jgi:hypothetical protein
VRKSKQRAAQLLYQVMLLKSTIAQWKKAVWEGRRGRELYTMASQHHMKRTLLKVSGGVGALQWPLSIT